ncbi:MAG: bifunctional enoyl-CoA hydratase/phosphate acetyltransferase [Negativicutes bacterium]
MIKSFSEIRTLLQSRQLKTVAVAAAHDDAVLHAIDAAIKEKLTKFILFGLADKITVICAKNNYDVSGCEIIDCSDDNAAAREAVLAVSSGKADALMKGDMPTATLLRAVLDKEIGLRTGRVLSHVGAFEFSGRIIIITDGGMIIKPDLAKKVDIITNSLQVTRALGIERAKIAVLAAVEVVNTDMPCTLDAAALTQMNRRGQIKGCIVDGPLALDNAISIEAAQHKGIVSEVAGCADVLVAPDIESGNILAKAFTYIGGLKLAGLIVGARKPIILTSRSDSFEAKLNSIALAVLAG